MPELALAYLFGFISCWILAFVFYLVSRARRSNRGYLAALANLKKIDLYFSDSRDRLVPWSELAEKDDQKATKRTIFLTGGLLSLLSWAGVLFLFIIMASYLFLARSRREKTLLASPLALDASLPRESVQTWVANHLGAGDP